MGRIRFAVLVALVILHGCVPLPSIEPVGDTRVMPEPAAVEGMWEIDHPDHRGDVVAVKLASDGTLAGAYLPLRSRPRFDVETGVGEVRSRGAVRFLNVTSARWCSEGCADAATRQPVLVWHIERVAQDEIVISAPRLRVVEAWIRDGRLPGLPCRQAFALTMGRDDQWCLGHLEAAHLDRMASPEGLAALFGESRAVLRRMKAGMAP